MATLTYLQAVILGLVQGLAEFLPVSSSGHLAILQHFFGISGDNVLMFTVLLHVGTLVSVFVVYWSDIVALLRELVFTIADLCRGRGLRLDSSPYRRLLVMIIVATIPTGIIGICFNNAFEGFYTNMLLIGVALLITGVILLIAEKAGHGSKQIERMNFRNAVFIGVMQGVAITPGISRSGSTLFGGLVVQLEREFAVKFAFLISIPSILGSALVEAPKAVQAGAAGMSVGPVILGVVVAALSGFIAIKFMIRIVSKQKLRYFSYYVWAIGAALIIYTLVA